MYAVETNDRSHRHAFRWFTQMKGVVFRLGLLFSFDGMIKSCHLKIKIFVLIRTQNQVHFMTEFRNVPAESQISRV